MITVFILGFIDKLYIYSYACFETSNYVANNDTNSNLYRKYHYLKNVSKTFDVSSKGPSSES